jgi:hypothetical protein
MERTSPSGRVRHRWKCWLRQRTTKVATLFFETSYKQQLLPLATDMADCTNRNKSYPRQCSEAPVVFHTLSILLNSLVLP